VPDTPQPKKPTYEQLEAENAALKARNAALEQQVASLIRRVEELERAGKRQASPFSKGDPKKDPKPPGRKPGEDYGKHCRRIRPAQVDETIEVTLPASCTCGGAVEEVEVVEQLQSDLPRIEPITRCFRIHVGCCRKCRKRIQPRHALQTSDALGAAGVQLGPTVLGLGSLLNKGFGLSWGKVSAFIERAFGLNAERSTYCRATGRLASRLEPTYDALAKAVAASPVVNVDETGWKVGGCRRWLWAFATRTETLYSIAASRGGDVAERVLGRYEGILGRDGWAAYRRFTSARHQSCLAHLLRRAHEILEFAQRGAARFPHGVSRALKAALALRDRRDEMSERGFSIARGHIQARMDRLLSWQPAFRPNAKFAAHLRNERPHLFTFLHEPAVDATNWRGEQAIRPAVITRKLSGGNRTDKGAHVQEVLTSVIRTCAQRAHDVLDLFVRTFRSTVPVNARLALAPSG
jgi:transposase